MGTHFSILAWEIPRIEEAGELQFMGERTDAEAETPILWLPDAKN